MGSLFFKNTSPQGQKSILIMIVMGLLGPMLLLGGFFKAILDSGFAGEEIVPAKIISSHKQNGRYGTDMMVFQVSYQPKETRERQTGKFSVYMNKADDVRARQPLEIAYRPSNYGAVRLPDEDSKAWLVLLVGAVFTGMAYWLFRRWCRGEFRATPDVKPVATATENKAEAKPNGVGAEQDLAARVRKSAESFTELWSESFGTKLSFDEASLRKVDGLIEQAWGGQPPANVNMMVELWGAFVGECIREELGGEWVLHEGKVPMLSGVGRADVKIFPFNKVHKRFVDGEDDSISFYYDALLHVIKKEDM